MKLQFTLSAWMLLWGSQIFAFDQPFSSNQPFAFNSQCRQPTFGPAREEGDKIYNFTVDLACSLSQEVEISEIKNKFVAYMERTQNYQVHRKAANIKYGQMTGFKLDVSEFVQTESSGTLNIRSDVYLVDNATDSFLLDSLSTSVKGSGDTKYTKYSRVSLILKQQAQGQHSVWFHKQIKVEKPWIAPRSTFISKVQEGLGKGIVDNAKSYMGIITSFE